MRKFVGTVPRLIKREFTGPRFHEGWTTLVYRKSVKQTQIAVSGVGICSIFLCCPLSVHGELTENCASCKVGHHHILRVLFVYGLSTILLLGGLGVEDRHKGRRWVTILLRVIFCGLRPKKKSVDRNPKYIRWTEQQTLDFFLGKVVRLRVRVQNVGVCVEIWR